MIDRVLPGFGEHVKYKIVNMTGFTAEEMVLSADLLNLEINPF